MDLSVEPGKEREVLKSVRDLLKDHILPRLTDLEIEVKYLREVCWPVCQGLREKTQLSDMQNKREFLKESTNSLDEILILLIEKEKINKKLEISTAQFTEEEFNRLFPERVSLGRRFGFE
jgi:hypothetical protein